MLGLNLAMAGACCKERSEFTGAEQVETVSTVETVVTQNKQVSKHWMNIFLRYVVVAIKYHI